MSNKACSACKRTLTLDKFHKHSCGAQGRRAKCKNCRKTLRREEYIKNSVKVAEQTSKYRRANLEVYTDATRRWHSANPGQRNSNRISYVADCLQRMPQWLSKQQKESIDLIYKQAKQLQKLNNSKDPLQVDHIIPLRGKLVSGLHVPWNLQIIPRSANIKKGNRI